MKKRTRKVNVVSKLLKKWQHLSQPAKIMSLVVICIGLILIVVQNTVQQANISLVGTPMASPSPYQQALSLDGTGYVYANNSTAINPDLSKGFTVEAWVKPMEATYSAMTIVNKSTSSGGAFNLWTDAGYNSGEKTYKANYYFAVGDSGCSSMHSTFYQQTYSTAEQATSWHHVAGVVQPGGKVDMYVDGKHLDGLGSSITSVCNSSLPILVGTRAGRTGESFRGYIDEVRISQVSRYAADFAVPIAPFLMKEDSLILYHFDSNLANANQDDKYGIKNGTLNYVTSTIPWGQAPTTPTPHPSPSAPASSVRPSPVASTRPTPSPYCYDQQVECVKAPCRPIRVCTSPNPSPNLGCRVDVYKLKATDLSTNATRYMTRDRLVDQSTYRVKAGDRFVYAASLFESSNDRTKTGVSTYQAKVTTVNEYGINEPIIVRLPNNRCTVIGKKTISCPSLTYTIPRSGALGSPIHTMFVTAQSTVKQIGSTSTTFVYSNDQATMMCGVKMYVTAPSPTPTPISSSIPRPTVYPSPSV